MPITERQSEPHPRRGHRRAAGLPGRRPVFEQKPSRLLPLHLGLFSGAAAARDAPLPAGQKGPLQESELDAWMGSHREQPSSR